MKKYVFTRVALSDKLQELARDLEETSKDLQFLSVVDMQNVLEQWQNDLFDIADMLSEEK